MDVSGIPAAAAASPVQFQFQFQFQGAGEEGGVRVSEGDSDIGCWQTRYGRAAKLRDRRYEAEVYRGIKWESCYNV